MIIITMIYLERQHVCSMNEKGNNLVNLEQLTDQTPLRSMFI